MLRTLVCTSIYKKKLRLLCLIWRILALWSNCHSSSQFTAYSLAWALCSAMPLEQTVLTFCPQSRCYPSWMPSSSCPWGPTLVTAVMPTFDRYRLLSPVRQQCSGHCLFTCHLHMAVLLCVPAMLIPFQHSFPVYTRFLGNSSACF